MARFRQGRIRYLVATDVVGRGIDVTRISHIINYDIPEFCDDYIYRVGRTGRMGGEGVAFTFVTPEEGPQLTRIEMRINRLLKRYELPGFEAFSKPEPEEEVARPETKPVFGRPRRRRRRAL
jgi:ATP-dependent RNA helicase DeaD